ncbi:MAG TPA: hypothetical protein VHJ40_03265, partial [Actinomycetota bacterium]|nr:hypothetical protein [Actinomycetota bacterium]
TPGIRKFALAAHLTISVGWIGTVVAYVALGVTAVRSENALMVRSAWMAMELIGWYVIVPAALLSLLTGLVMALGTKSGLFRYYWVLFSLVLTIVATVVLILHMPTVSFLADAAQGAEAGALESLGSDLLHPGLGLVVLLVILGLNVFKPEGLTRYGRRKQYEHRSGLQQAMKAPVPHPDQGTVRRPADV